jgi:hypothetical protein
MKVPAAHFAQIDRAKVEDYLLSPFHPVGRFKAVVFYALGYSRSSWQQLDSDLWEHLQINDVVETQRNAFGLKYVVGGNLVTPSGAAADFLTVWIILDGESVPRFVTAYPGEDR